MRAHVFAALALAGCVSDYSPAAVDAAFDTAGSPMEASTDAPADTTASDGGQDASDGGACTPLTSAQSSCTGAMGATTPAYYFTYGLVPQGCFAQGSCYPHLTPPKCRCAETYNCACILPQARCADGGQCTCDDSTGTVIVTCS